MAVSTNDAVVFAITTKMYAAGSHDEPTTPPQERQETFGIVRLGEAAADARTDEDYLKLGPAKSPTRRPGHGRPKTLAVSAPGGPDGFNSADNPNACVNDDPKRR